MSGKLQVPYAEPSQDTHRIGCLLIFTADLEVVMKKGVFASV